MTERDVARPEDTRAPDRADEFGGFHHLTSAGVPTRGLFPRGVWERLKKKGTCLDRVRHAIGTAADRGRGLP
ncbi:hypothetical protein ACFYY8_28160 [Streptosporangium sp. NPDC001559]|uniref:hypothetical protein n=1 Tax=Streptosporangium sp. NPDC001559 TaxID=3366187 RepID=UPI0036E34406